MTIFDANGKKLFIDFDFINPSCEINIFSHLIKDTKVIFFKKKGKLFNFFLGL